MCYYPYRKDHSKVRNWVKQNKPYSAIWPTYPIRILSTTEDFNQGERRLKKSFTSASIETSDSEKRKKKKLDSKADSSSIKLSLADVTPLPKSQTGTSISETTDKSTLSSGRSSMLEEDSRDDGFTEPRGCDESYYIINELKKYVVSEFEGMKKSLIYEIKKQFTRMMETVEIENAKKSVDDSPWKIIESQFPCESTDQFVELETALVENQVKQDALKQIYHLLTVGSNDFKRDVQTIIGKLISKVVQLDYSGTGRKIKGVGKKSFQDTQSYKCMSEFLQEKYKNSSVKLTILTATSHYLSGAGDREGGKRKRLLTDIGDL
ncbi:uncharacterized protein LOC123261395 [Cotesia glomerata]|uniref:uncharacterized protein LOC123261395 n=1 Tax=Cotesia glomerata TaxID=32391 RepID=UPI001D02A4A7|nr:uncharacterized protein LOC123261395 [Cotesia glomerata]